jgi:hypothetical protein
VDWLFYAAVALGVVAAIDSIFWDARVTRNLILPHDAQVLVYASGALRAPRTGLPFWLVRFGIVFALAAVLVWLLVRPLLWFNWTGPIGYVRIVLLALTASLLWLALDALALRAGGRAMALAMAIVAALGAMTITLSGSQKLGQLAGLLTAATFAVAVLGLFFPGLMTARAMVIVFVMLHASLVLSANEHVYASLRTTNAILLLIAAPLGWLGLLVPARRAGMRAASQLVAMVVPAAAAAILAAIAFARAAQDYSDFPG